VRRAAAGVCLLLTACPAPRTHDGTPYGNARFGFGVYVPRGWTVFEPDNGDGLRMTSPDHADLHVSVSGTHNEWKVKSLDALRRMQEHVVANPLPRYRAVRTGGLEGVEYDNFKPGEMIVSLHQLLLRGEILYSLELSGADSRTPEAERLFHRICDGFRPIRGIEIP